MLHIQCTRTEKNFFPVFVVVVLVMVGVVIVVVFDTVILRFLLPLILICTLSLIISVYV